MYIMIIIVAIEFFYRQCWLAATEDIILDVSCSLHILGGSGGDDGKEYKGMKRESRVKTPDVDGKIQQIIWYFTTEKRGVSGTVISVFGSDVGLYLEAHGDERNDCGKEERKWWVGKWWTEKRGMVDSATTGKKNTEIKKMKKITKKKRDLNASWWNVIWHSVFVDKCNFYPV